MTKDLIETLGFVDGLYDPANAAEALPSGFDTYLCVLHRIDDKMGHRINYKAPGEELNWSEVHKVQEGATLSGSEYREGRLDSVSAGVLIRLLQIANDEEFTATYFFDERSVRRISGTELKSALSDESLQGPLMWFPDDLRWVASSPADEWQTYLGVDHQIAQRLKIEPELEMIDCHFALGLR